MKYIKIFLASSLSEFKEDRRELGDYIRKLNNVYCKRGIYFELVVCEDISDSLAEERKQEEYNAEIRDCQYFYIIFGKEAGRYSVEEFNVALEQFKKTGNPHIYTYFQKLPDDNDVDASIKEFIGRLDSELNHYYSKFSHLDTIKLNILLELTRNQEIGGSVQFENGAANVDGEGVLSLDRIPLYNNNSGLQQLRMKKEKREKEFSDLLVRAAQFPDDAAIKKGIEDNVRERYQLQKRIQEYEESMYELCRKAESIRHSSSSLSWRQREALKFVDLGDYDNALRILQDSIWSEEKEQAKDKLRQIELAKEKSLDVIRDYISGKRLLITTIAFSGIAEEQEEQIVDIYQDIVPDVLTYEIQLETVYEYACFLRNHNRHAQAIRILKELVVKYKKIGTKSSLADAEYLLACILYKVNQIEESKKYHEDALHIRTELKEDSLEEMLKFAQSCNQLGYLMFRTYHFEKAETYYSDALLIQSDLQGDYRVDGQKVLRDTALTMNNLAVLYENNHKASHAKTMHNRALKIRKKLAEDESVEAPGYLAMSCLNYAKFLSRHSENPDEASIYYQRAIDLYIEISKKDSKHLVDRAIAGYYYACFMERYDKEKALKLHQEVLQSRFLLSIDNRDALASDLTDSYFAVGRLTCEFGNEIEAKAMLEKSLTMKKKLAQKAPEKHQKSLDEMIAYINSL